MKYLIVAASLLALSASAASAGEGTGDPFPFRAGTPPIASVPTRVTQMVGKTPQISIRPPNSMPSDPRATAAALEYASVPLTQGAVLPTDGSQGAVQTANSLPQGFEQGTVPYEQAQSVQQYLARQQQRDAARAYAQSPHVGWTGTGG